MSKRKRASLGKIPATPPSGPEADESTDDAAVKENMVHVTPDLLAGSPDIFASKKSASGAEPEAVTEPIEEPAQAEAEPTEASTTLTPTEEAPPFSTESHSAPQPTFVAATPYPAQPRRGLALLGLWLVPRRAGRSRPGHVPAGAAGSRPERLADRADAALRQPDDLPDRLRRVRVDPGHQRPRLLRARRKGGLACPADPGRDHPPRAQRAEEPPDLAARQTLAEPVPRDLVCRAGSVLLEPERAIDLEHRRVRPGVAGADPFGGWIQVANVEEHRGLDPLTEAAAASVGPDPGELLLDERRPIRCPIDLCNA